MNKNQKAARRKVQQAAKQRRQERIQQRIEYNKRANEYGEAFNGTSPVKKHKRIPLKTAMIHPDDDLVKEVFGTSYFCMKDHG